MLNEAILSGVGIGVMARLSGDSFEELRRLTPNIGVSLPLRVLTHSDLRLSPAVKAVLAWIDQVLGNERQRIEADDAELSDAGADDDGNDQ